MSVEGRKCVFAGECVCERPASVPESTLYCKIYRTSHVTPLRARQMVAVQYTSVIILSAAKYSALGCKAVPAVVYFWFTAFKFQSTTTSRSLHAFYQQASDWLAGHMLPPQHTKTPPLTYTKIHTRCQQFTYYHVNRNKRK